MRIWAKYVLVLWLAGLAFAAPVTVDQVSNVAHGWLDSNLSELGLTDKQVAAIEASTDTDGAVIYYVVRLQPEGYVVISADDQVEPIIAFAAQGSFDDSAQNPLTILLQNDLPDRYENLDAIVLAASEDAETISPQTKWAAFEGIGLQSDTPSFIFLSDVRVWPIVQSKWSQRYADGDYCYNYYTPNNYPIGCVANALAQILRHHSYPAAPAAGMGNVIEIDGLPEVVFPRGGDGSGGPYQWDQMPLIPDEGLTTTQRQAIGALCYDAGVAVGMKYSDDGSSAPMTAVADALQYFFNYGNAVFSGTEADGYTLEQLQPMMNPGLDAGYPTILGIRSSTVGNGHAVIVDGYGYVSTTPYHHVNMGWGGSYNVWYNLPSIRTNSHDFDTMTDVIYNIYPQGRGAILSGRIFDTSGDLLQGVSVRVVNSDGPVYLDVTDEKGIYALSRIPAGSLTIVATKTGYRDAIITASVSESSEGSCGNVWGANICLFPDGASSTYGGGDGSPQDPYRIATAEHLLELSYNTSDFDKHFVMTNDIDMASYPFTKAVIAPDTDSTTTFAGTKFTGSFNGNLHTLSNLTIDTAGASNHYLGLFGFIDQTATVENLIIDNLYISTGGSSRGVGGVCGENNGTIRNVGVTGTIYGHYFSSRNMGGIAGHQQNGAEIEYCYTDVELTGAHNLGGIVGWNNASVNYVFSLGSVTAWDYPNTQENIGGLIGCNFISMTQSYSACAVTRLSSAALMGALCGYHVSGQLSQCFYDYVQSVPSACGYTAGSVYQVYGKSTSEMKQQSTYTSYGWDFDNTWTMSAADSQFEGCPTFQWLPTNTDPTLQSIEIVGPTTMRETEMGVFQCIAHYSDGSTENVSTQTKLTVQSVAPPAAPSDPNLVETEPEEEPSPVGYGAKGAALEFSSNGGDNSAIFSMNGQDVELSSDVVADIQTSMQVTGSDGMTLITTSVGQDTPTEILAEHNGVQTTHTVTVENRTYDFVGSGTAGDPYQLTTTEQFLDFCSNTYYYNKHAKLMSDIDLSDYYFMAAVLAADEESTEGFQGTAFTGVFDGGGHRISGLKITSVDLHDSYLGLFGQIGPGGVVRNLFVDYVALQCMNADHISSLCGCNYGTIMNCYVAGLILLPENAEIAGIVCGANHGAIVNSCSYGVVTPQTDAGGFCGVNTGSIATCYAVAVVEDMAGVGVFCGNNTGSIDNCFWDSDVSGISSGSSGTSATTSAMMTQSTYIDAGWNFAGGWLLCQDGLKYPQLIWQRQATPGDFTCPDGVDILDMMALATGWLSNPTDPHWQDMLDIDDAGASENVIDLADFAAFTELWP